MSNTGKIYLKHFSIRPGGIQREDSSVSAEAFRDDILLPALTLHDTIEVDVDVPFGVASNFLYHSIGRLVDFGIDVNRVKIISSDPSIIYEINEYWGK